LLKGIGFVKNELASHRISTQGAQT